MIKKHSGWVKHIRFLSNIFIVLQKDGLEKQFIVKLKNKEESDLYKIPLDSFLELEYEEIPFKDKVDLVVKNITYQNSNKLDISSRNKATNFQSRWMDLRDSENLSRLQTKTKLYLHIRQFMQEEGFLDVYTPILGIHTEEGARSFESVSYVTKKKYSLSQSPQIYKQIAMYSGISKYFQICQCFRDEDTKNNRLFGSFDQLDVEMHTGSLYYVILFAFRILKKILSFLRVFDNKLRFKIITYDEAMEKYKTDKPILKDTIFAVTEFPLFEMDGDIIKTAHNPFTKQIENTNKGYQFDIVWNGIEIASGGLRCTDWEEFYKNYSKIIDSNIVNSKYGFFKKMWDSGVPNHGGFAFGLDRIIAEALKCRLEDLYLVPFNKQGVIEFLE